MCCMAAPQVLNIIGRCAPETWQQSTFPKHCRPDLAPVPCSRTVRATSASYTVMHRRCEAPEQAVVLQSMEGMLPQLDAAAPE